MTFTPRVGVYICHCGINIAATVDVEAVKQFAAHLPGVVVSRHYTYMCSDPGQDMIKQDITDFDLNRVVVASCTPRMHELTFRATVAEKGLNPYCFEMANIREQCSWVHIADDLTTQKAMELVASTVAKAALVTPLEERQASVTPSALVIGGGIAGMQAALDIAEAGFEVVLLERTTQLGGHAAQLYQTYPTLEPVADLIYQIIDQVSNHPKINVMTESEVEGVTGFVGNFIVRVGSSNGASEIPAGVIILATGFEVFNAQDKPELAYGVYPEVITTLELEQMLCSETLNPDLISIVFIQCVGSRDRTTGNTYCSRVCCMVTAKQAHQLRDRFPQAQVNVFFMDVRAFGKGYEEFYDQVRSEQVIYRRGNPSEIIRRNGRVVVRAEDTLLSKLVEVEADLVVLAVGMLPHPEANQVAKLLKLSRSEDKFFMEAHPKLRPVETATAGVFLAGCCQGPKDIVESLAHARAAASSALILLIKGQVRVEAATAFIDRDLCAGCGQCAAVCPYAALTLHPVLGTMTVNPVLCRGCGSCAAACPSSAINIHHFTFDQFIAQIEALSIGFQLPTKKPEIEVVVT
ncbi:MAG: CoB--CoM heterodisulfide reductase iron-sulfur subunit A family protein [Anaerolineales bacterium]